MLGLYKVTYNSCWDCSRELSLHSTMKSGIYFQTFMLSVVNVVMVLDVVRALDMDTQIEEGFWANCFK